MRDKVSSRQLGIMVFLSLLSPIVRLLPVSSLASAGRTAWLSPLPSGVAACLFAPLISMLAGKLKPQGGDLLRCSLGRFWGGAFSAVFASLRSDINQKICGSDCIFVMLNHNHAVSDIAQTRQGAKQSVVVSLVQTD